MEKLNQNPNLLIKAARNRAEASRDTALATLEVYFKRSVAIGEHPDLSTEIDKYLDILGTASDRLEAIAYYENYKWAEEGLDNYDSDGK